MSIKLHCNSDIVVLTVQFSQSTFSGSEESGSISVTLLLEEGTSTTDITVTVIPFDQTPVSAEGKRCVSYTLISQC